MADVINLQQVLEALAASGADTDALLTAVGEISSVPAGGFSTPVNTLYTLESANGTPLANVVNISRQAAEQAGQVGNSNIAGAAGTFTNSQGASAAAGQTAGASTFFGGAKKFLNQTLVGTEHFGVGTIAASIAAVCVGAKAGKWLDKLAYDTGKLIGFDVADTLDPDTWNSITYDMADSGLEGVYKRGIQMLLGLDQNTGEMQAYIPQNAFNYLAYTLAQMGLFDAGETTATNDSSTAGMTSSQLASYSNIAQPVSLGSASCVCEYYQDTEHKKVRKYELNAIGTSTVYSLLNTNETGAFSFGFISDAPFSVSGTLHIITVATGNDRTTQISNNSVYANYTVGGVKRTAYSYFVTGPTPLADFINATAPLNHFSGDWYIGPQMDYSMLHWLLYTGNIHTGSTYPGSGNQQGATIPPINSSSTPQQVADAMNNTFPDLEGNRVEMPVAVPATVPKPVTYVQVPLPSTVAGNNPTVEPTATPQADPNINPQTATDPLSALLLKLLTQPYASNMPDPANDPEEYPEGKPEEKPNTNPPDVGSGVTPPLNVPVGSASALWAVYNPTQAQIDALGAWLWSNNFVDQLLKMFNDPMQAIIGLHKTFIPPIVGGAQDIKVGYLNSGVSALTVPVQYSTIDCGTINCAEYFGNVFDYAPYTRVYLYLPFIGFKELDVAQVMRGRINVKYRGDAYTGCCLAEVSVTRDGESGGVLYTYSGDCAARYPLSHGSYMGIVNAIAGIGIGIGTALAGAPSVGIAGAVGMAQHARATVEHSGSFSGNSGAMGIKKPYLVIMRPQTAMAKNYEHFTGQPSNSNVVLGSASGYVRVKECHVEDIATATDAEKQMIESALKTGVII